MIGGYRPNGNGVDALLVGYYDDTGLRFAGKVRVGFVPHLRRELAKAMKPLHVDRCPFVDLPNSKSDRWGGGVTADEMGEMQWVKPKLVAQIRFVDGRPRVGCGTPRSLGCVVTRPRKKSVANERDGHLRLAAPVARGALQVQRDCTMTDTVPTSAYVEEATGRYHATGLTRGPWHPDHQHAGPPIALVCRAVENAAREQGLTHLSRITASLLRPLPIGEMAIEVATDYTGRNAGHYSARLIAAGKEVARFTALMQRETAVTLPDTLPGHPLPALLPAPEECPVATFPFAGPRLGYADLVETRLARGHFFRGPCATWFRLRHPLLEGALPGSYERVAVAADSGNGISAILDFSKYVFVNSDLTINLLRRPQGEWIGLDARTQLGPDGGGLAESALFDGHGLIGRATQSLSVRRRE